MLIRYAVSIYLEDFKTLPDFDEYGASIFGDTPYMKLGRFEEHEIFQEYGVSDSMNTPYRSPSYLKTMTGLN